MYICGVKKCMYCVYGNVVEYVKYKWVLFEKFEIFIVWKLW